MIQYKKSAVDDRSPAQTEHFRVWAEVMQMGVPDCLADLNLSLACQNLHRLDMKKCVGSFLQKEEVEDVTIVAYQNIHGQHFLYIFKKTPDGKLPHVMKELPIEVFSEFERLRAKSENAQDSLAKRQALLMGFLGGEDSVDISTIRKLSFPPRIGLSNLVYSFYVRDQICFFHNGTIHEATPMMTSLMTCLKPHFKTYSMLMLIMAKELMPGLSKEDPIHLSPVGHAISPLKQIKEYPEWLKKMMDVNEKYRFDEKFRIIRSESGKAIPSQMWSSEFKDLQFMGQVIAYLSIEEEECMNRLVEAVRSCMNQTGSSYDGVETVGASGRSLYVIDEGDHDEI